MNPRFGRFISRDKLGFEGGLNLWAYPRNPVNSTDPLGMWALMSSGSALLAVAEKDNEDYFELFDPVNGIWGAIEPDHLPPSKISGVMTEPCKVFVGDVFDISSFLPPLLRSTLNRDGHGNCRSSVIGYPNVNLDARSLPPENFDNELIQRHYHESIKKRGVIFNIKIGRILVNPPPISWVPHKAVHAGAIIYQSKVSGKFFVWNKKGEGFAVGGRAVIQSFDESVQQHIIDRIEPEFAYWEP